MTVERNVVSAQRQPRDPRAKRATSCLLTSVHDGDFSRQFFLGDNLDASKLAADLDRGVLTLTIPVAEKSKAAPRVRSARRHRGLLMSPAEAPDLSRPRATRSPPTLNKEGTCHGPGGRY